MSRSRRRALGRRLQQIRPILNSNGRQALGGLHLQKIRQLLSSNGQQALFIFEREGPRREEERDAT